MLSRRNVLALSALTPLALTARAVRLNADDGVPGPASHQAGQMATVGIIAGQLARLSVFHHFDEVIGPCGFEATLVGVNGKTVASADGVVAPGQGAFVDFDPAAALKKGERLQLHANVLVPAEHSKHVGATLELFDRKTGATSMQVTPCGVIAPLAGMGTVGIVNGQIVRLSLFHHADEAVTPCGYRIDLIGIDGKVLATDSGKILPGQGAVHDYVAAAALAKGERVQFHATLRVPPSHALGALVEVFDARTAVTGFAVGPCGIEDPALG